MLHDYYCVEMGIYIYAGECKEYCKVDGNKCPFRKPINK